MHVLRKFALVITAVFALAAAAPATTATTTVQITKVGFVPKNITVVQGDQVTWQNSDTASHQVVSQAGGWASPILQAGDTWTRTFEKLGKFTYVDSQQSGLSGSVTVKAAPGSVTLDSSASVVTYGGRTTLSGAVSNKQSNEKVDVYRIECSKSAQSMTKIDTVTTSAGGAFSMSVQPLENTSYQVRWGDATSQLVSVKAKPRLRLGKIAPHRYTIRTLASASFAGRYVTVQRWVPAYGTWKGVRTALLRPNSSGIDPTVVSSVTFKLVVKRHTKLRVVMTQRQVGACYLPGTSNAIFS